MFPHVSGCVKSQIINPLDLKESISHEASPCSE
jgi:hypothetical protein